MSSPSQRTSLSEDGISPKETASPVNKELIIMGVPIQSLPITFRQTQIEDTHEVKSLKEKSLAVMQQNSTQHDIEEHVGDTGSLFKHMSVNPHKERHLSGEEQQTFAHKRGQETSGEAKDESQVRQEWELQAVRPSEEGGDSLFTIPDLSDGKPKPRTQMTPVTNDPLTEATRCSSFCNKPNPVTFAKAIKRAVASQHRLPTSGKQSDHQQSSEGRVCSPSNIGSMWLGFKSNFPKYTDHPKYKPSRLLDLSNDLDVLQKSDGKLKLDSLSPVRSFSSLTGPSAHSLGIRKDAVVMNRSYDTVPDCEDIYEIFHKFPCNCPENCIGKLAQSYKKDNRTWLWKNKESREKALGVCFQM